MKYFRIILFLGFFAVYQPLSGSNTQQRVDSLRLLLEKATDPAEKSALLKQLTRLSFESGDYFSASEFLKDEIQHNLLVVDSVSWANACYNLGMVNSITRNFEEAIQYSRVALDYFEANRMFAQIANCCINLGYIYNEQRQYDQALEYYFRAQMIFEDMKEQQGMEASYLNLGVLGSEQGDVGKTRQIYEQSQGVSQSINMTSLMSVYINIGNIFQSKQDFVQAESFLDKAFALAKQNNNQQYLATSQVYLGSVYFKTGRKAEAYRTIEKGIELAKLVKLRPLIMEAYGELARVSMSLNQPKLAYIFLETYSKYKDSLYNEQLALQMSHVRSKFETGSRELDSERLLRENLEQSLNMEREQKSRIALITVLVLVIVFMGFFFKRYYVKARSAENFEESNKIILKQKAELEQLIATKDRFLSIIAHDLKNPFTSLLGFADLAYTEFNEITDQEKLSYLGIIRQSSQNIYALLENLLTWSRAQSGRIDFNPEPVDLPEIVDFSIDVVRSAAENKQISLYTDFSKDVIVKADKNMLSTVLRNLLSNAIKFTPNGGSVTISCLCNNGKASLSVADTGVGLEQDELSRLFKIDGNLKNPGTNNETGTGLGLILCQEFMNIHKSRITAESTPGKGSVFSFSLDVI